MTLYKQLLTRNACYITGKSLKPIGAMLHSTGAKNPNLSRYAPGDAIIGINPNGNHWNIYHPGGRDIGPHTYVNRDGDYTCDKCGGRQVAVHAFIGKTADGSVATVQTLPWTMRAWHGGKSKANNQYIGVEICEDGLEDPVYFATVYREAVELFAMLSQLFKWDPLADGTIICHAEGYKRGVASNHGDVLHWFPRHGKTMDDFRADVARTLQGEEDEDMAPRYNTVAEIHDAASWADTTIRKMIDKGYISGGGKKDANGDPADMNLSMDMLRMLVMLNAAGAFDK